MRRILLVPLLLVLLVYPGEPSRAISPVPPVAFALTAATAKAMTMVPGTCSYEAYNGDASNPVYWSVGTANSYKPTASNGSGIIPPKSFKDWNDIPYQPSSGQLVIWLYSTGGESSGVVTFNGFCP